VVRALLARGDQVRAILRQPAQGASLEAQGVELWPGDLTRPATLEGACRNVDVVMHTACAVASTFEQFLAVNRDGTLNLARETLRYSGLRFVHVSSTAAMGTPAEGRVDESTPCRPKTPYQVSKREAELALLGLHARENLNVVILRPCVVAGEGKRDSELLKLFRLVRRGLLPVIGPTAELQKPIIFIDDLVQAILLAADRGRAGQVYLIHSGGQHTLGQIIEVAGRLVGARRTHLRVPLWAARAAARGLSWLQRVRPDWNPPLTPERIELFVADRHIDISKAKSELGYSPQHQDLDEMLGRTYHWYREQNLL
jgi:nucleoside-diphosphate-sugar epimerase